ncbi:MAG TPA: CBS domain-containing protein, partial [Bacillota bacterium]|nr:CBS domain-containing protein [Bacillota bacterium]
MRRGSSMQLLVKDVMTKHLIKLKKSDTIGEVAQIFLNRSIDGAPIVDDKNKVIGMFTKTHLIRAMATGMALQTPIERLMVKNIITINEKMQAEEALAIPVGRLPVVNDKGNLVGWLTRTDLANAFFNRYKPLMESLLPALNITRVALVTVDTEGYITICNQATDELWGLQEGRTFIGQHVEAVFPSQKIGEVLTTGQPTGGNPAGEGG